MKLISLFLPLTFLCGPAFADDLESLLDDPAPAATTQTQKPKLSGMAAVVKKHLGNRTSPEENAFLRALESAHWDQATLLFPKAFENGSFASSSLGGAVFGYIQFQAGLQVNGLETLFLAQKPQELGDLMKQSWAQLAPENHPAWNLVHVKWSTAWTEIFGKSIEYQLKLRDVQSLSLQELKRLSAEAPVNSAIKAKIDWKLTLAYAVNDEADQAGKILARLMKSSHSPVDQDLMQLTAARLLFQNGNLDAAIRYDQKVSRSSDYWLEAQEEMAWAYIRKGQPQDAIALTRSLDTPSFANQIRAETFLVASLANLKVCDYPAVVKSIEVFPKQFKSRTKNLEALIADQEPDAAEQVLIRMKKKPLMAIDLKGLANNLPRRILFDERLQSLAKASGELETEANLAHKLYAQSLSVTGLQGYFESVHKDLLSRQRQASTAAQSRIRELAKMEVAETKVVLNKMHIVEAEVVQQVALADDLAKNSAKKVAENNLGSTGAKGSETLRFPADNEVWMDEIGNYKVDVKKACHSQRAIK